MRLLAIETSSDACSVAIGIDGEVLERHTVEARAHTQKLMPMITELLAASGMEISALDAIVLGNGPGSFIGMRIGASVAQGICHGAGLKLIPISSLAAIAAEVFTDEITASSVLVAQDARMNEVYLGRFAKGAEGMPVAAGAESICPVGPLPVENPPLHAAGGAWHKYPQLMQDNARHIASLSPIVVPRARYLLRLAAISGESIAPEKLEPAYLRTRVAAVPARST